mmetsp:Transcript_20669/g.29173  ORF Transcript_20669/g.29173 Transcript_20669/m.29173 type:complete len:219 (+) Transcript_20669:472-1128(+)
MGPVPIPTVSVATAVTIRHNTQSIQVMVVVVRVPGDAIKNNINKTKERLMAQLVLHLSSIQAFITIIISNNIKTGKATLTTARILPRYLHGEVFLHHHHNIIRIPHHNTNTNITIIKTNMATTDCTLRIETTIRPIFSHQEGSTKIVQISTHHLALTLHQLLVLRWDIHNRSSSMGIHRLVFDSLHGINTTSINNPRGRHQEVIYAHLHLPQLLPVAV